VLEEEDTNQGWHLNDGEEEDMILVAQHGNKWLGDRKLPPPCSDEAGDEGCLWRGLINSLTPKSVLAGTKNSRLEGFWLAKHKHTNIPSMMEPFSPPVAWF
jgi:hypothetical protein